MSSSTKRLIRFFNSNLHPQLRATPEEMTRNRLQASDYLLAVCEKWHPEPDRWDETPTGIEAFLTAMRFGFSAKYCQQLEYNIDYFSAKVDDKEGRMAGGFLSLWTIREWMEYLMRELMWALKEEDERITGWKTAGPSSPAPDHKPESDSPVIEVRLQGPNLRDAWLAWTPRNNTGPSVPIPLPLSSRMAPHFDPAVSSRQYLYHAFGRRNEMSPEGAIYLNCSPPRSFLWAVFLSDMASTNQDGVERSWILNGQRYQGTLLFEYCLEIPPDPEKSGCQQVILSKEQATRWTWAISGRGVPLDRLWLLVRGIITGSTLHRWPDFLHAPELEETETALGGWSHPRLLQRPLWRTAVCTPAGKALVKRSRVAVYVITYQQTAGRRKGWRAFGRRLVSFWEPRA
ncbi:MAG: serine protease [Watsoniomyces obsoletus]|nr:MAG: serine protease [Watsoniomyces obsoletus]